MIAAPPECETRSFPVSLVCPQCAQPIGDGQQCACGLRRLQWWHDLPRTLFGQSYWGETSQEKMRQILDRLDTTHWREALEQVVGGEAVFHHLNEEIGADFVYSMPWDKIRTVLEIGPGMGFMTAPLAKFAESVVAVEAVPERALFLAQRARQDNLNNVHPIIASGTALPFAPQSFDLVAMNGVFEYIGLWGDGDPQQLQQRFIERVFQLLKPGGFFYVGIETRLGLGAWLGSRDHSGLRFTSLMPRWLADWYCRRRHVPLYGSADASDGYRTYTYTPRQYDKMLRRAGFGTVEVHGVFDGYNRQVGIAPLDDFNVWKKTRLIIDTPCSALGSLRRLVSQNRFLYRTLENEVVVFGCKQPDAGPLFWSGLDRHDGVAQLNTGKKVGALLFDAGRPTVFAQAAKNDAAHRRMQHVYDLLHRAQKTLGDELAGFEVRWPKPLNKQSCHRLTFFEWEFAEGDLLSKLLLPRNYRPGRFAELLKRLTRGYLTMTARLTDALGTPRSSWRDLLGRWSQIQLDDRGLQERLQSACRKLADRPWRLQVIHGDLTFNNVILSADGTMVLVDWENVTDHGLPSIDLVRLLYDAWKDSKVFGPAQAQAFLANVRGEVSATLTRLGIDADDFRDLEMMFVAHQHEFDRSRKCEVTTMLGAYAEPSFTLF